MKNQLTDLNDHLFAQLERLSEEGLGGEALDKELRRTNAVTSVAHQIIDNARLVLDAEKAKTDLLIENPLPMLSGPKR